MKEQNIIAFHLIKQIAELKEQRMELDEKESDLFYQLFSLFDDGDTKISSDVHTEG